MQSQPKSGSGETRFSRSEITRSIPARAAAALMLLCTWLFMVACEPSGISNAPPTPIPEAATGDPAARQAATPRIVVLISIDTLRADHLGLYGYTRFTSPMLDVFSQESTVFDDASTAAPWTLPSHATMLTGLFPMTHQVVTFSTKLVDEAPTLASMLADEGFVTGAAVSAKWLKRTQYNLTKDFERYVEVSTKPWRKLPSTLITNQAIEWIQETPDEKLFLLLHYFDVHGDYTSEEAYEKMFVEPYVGIADGTSWQLLQSNLEPEYIAMCTENFDKDRCTFGAKTQKKLIDENFERVLFNEADAAHLINLYDAGIRQMDTEIGRLFALLRQEGVLDESLIIVTSDHGEEFLDHGRVDHFLSPHQEVMRVPLIMRGPGFPAGRRVDAPVSLVDLAPTILEAVGAPLPPNLEGLSLLPLLHDENDDAPYRQRYIYGEAPGGLTYESIAPGMFPVIQAVRRDNWKLIYDSKKDTYALYDLASDPKEKIDLSAEKPQIAAPLIEEMRRRYADFAPDTLDNATVELSEEELEELRALGYVP